jgi:lipopolysaccharide/colanic/teichoic acid biosynthesis glycosyltransferase
MQARHMDEAVVSHHRSGFRVSKRALDVIAALAGLIVSAPIALLVALAIRLDTPGPIFFSQIRLGQGGRLIRIYKFRKFRAEPASSGLPLTLRTDPRLTRVGALLERTKLNELPQLWNILLGDMSLVGPRPETLEFRACFDGAFRRILWYKPGLLGPSQYFFRNESYLYPEGIDHQDFYRKTLFVVKAKIDLSYYEGNTLWQDIGWVFRCISAVMFRPVLGNAADWVKTAEDWTSREIRSSARTRDETRRPWIHP